MWGQNLGKGREQGHMLKFKPSPYMDPRPLSTTSASPCEGHKEERQHAGNTWWRPQVLERLGPPVLCYRHHLSCARAACCPPGSAFKGHRAAKDDAHRYFHVTSLFGTCVKEQASHPETARLYIMCSNTTAPLRHSNVPCWCH